MGVKVGVRVGVRVGVNECIRAGWMSTFIALPDV
jgi:hypothetical protein